MKDLIVYKEKCKELQERLNFYEYREKEMNLKDSLNTNDVTRDENDCFENIQRDSLVGDESIGFEDGLKRMIKDISDGSMVIMIIENDLIQR